MFSNVIDVQKKKKNLMPSSSAMLQNVTFYKFAILFLK